LLFTDLDRLAKLVNNPDRPIQFLFTGKAHPADGAGQGLIKRIVEISRRPEFLGKIIFIENYDMQLAKRMISGVDIWLNTPTRPLEASGTSGEKAVMNGVLNFSVLDGWWYEGYRENAGWALTDKRSYENQNYQDELDAAEIYSTFENVILPLYYARNSKGYSPQWIQYIKNCIAEIAPHYTTKRMIDDYIARFYQPAAHRHDLVSRNNYDIARQLAAWKEDVMATWDSITVEQIRVNGEEPHEGVLTDRFENEEVFTQVIIDKKQMKGDLGLEIVLVESDSKTGEDVFVDTLPFTLQKTEGSRLFFENRSKIVYTGNYKYSYRLFPVHTHLIHRMDFAWAKWF
jgi:starch phosphorylase